MRFAQHQVFDLRSGAVQVVVGVDIEEKGVSGVIRIYTRRQSPVTLRLLCPSRSPARAWSLRRGCNGFSLNKRSRSFTVRCSLADRRLIFLRNPFDGSSIMRGPYLRIGRPRYRTS